MRCLLAEMVYLIFFPTPNASVIPRVLTRIAFRGERESFRGGLHSAFLRLPIGEPSLHKIRAVLYLYNPHPQPFISSPFQYYLVYNLPQHQRRHPRQFASLLATCAPRP
ncbi:hypothetical protein K439DRAFT_210126 [Ramaria rubella]|nr:hypothetical protein K439DRAFT_210126 [Ramaria rubella]